MEEGTAGKTEWSKTCIICGRKIGARERRENKVDRLKRYM